jgi:hypothetical protein
MAKWPSFVYGDIKKNFEVFNHFSTTPAPSMLRYQAVLRIRNVYPGPEIFHP